MDKLRVAVIMEDVIPTEGGGYSYYQTLLSAIDRYAFHEDIEIINLDFYNRIPNNLQFRKQLIKIKKNLFALIAYRCLDFFYKLVHKVWKNNGRFYLELISWFMDSINNSAARKVLIKEKIHLVYYLKPKDNLVNYPMIITHWDVGHKSMFPFPEVAWDGNFEKREKYYRIMLSRAFLILCESVTGAKELQYYYSVNPDRIKVMPLFGGDVLQTRVSEEEQSEVLAIYNLSAYQFYIYPAQFWAHKNHSTLIQAFKMLLLEPGTEYLKLVLCGGDQGNLLYIKELINSLGLNEKIVIPGFITNRQLYSLYKNAIALVMPTFLGPTNIPLLEAAQLKCAVLCSDLAGHKEMLGNNALYFEPSNASDIKNCMSRIRDVEVRNDFVLSAYKHVRESSFQVEKSIPLLDRYLQEIKPVLKTWA